MRQNRPIGGQRARIHGNQQRRFGRQVVHGDQAAVVTNGNRDAVAMTTPIQGEGGGGFVCSETEKDCFQSGTKFNPTLIKFRQECYLTS